VTPAQVGQQLGAAYVLTGTLRRAGARLRINAQLVDAHTDFPLWSERFDREMKTFSKYKTKWPARSPRPCA